MTYLYPVRLEASLHETIWGGRRFERDGWKALPPSIAIGEAWETEISTIVQNGPYTGKTLGALVDELGVALLGVQSIAIFGNRFPLLAKFIDANAKLSVQVHPDDTYASHYENGKLGKTEFWYILAAEPGATIVHGFKAPTTRIKVQNAIERRTLEDLLHEEFVHAGDVIFVPAGTVHAIGSGVMLYELQEYSDITYRMYDYGRLTTSGTPRELHIERSLDVSQYDTSARIKFTPTLLASGKGYDERCLVACPYFVTREITFKDTHNLYGYMKCKTSGSCIILTSLGASSIIRFGHSLKESEQLSSGQTMILPADLGNYCIEGSGTLLFSYVPSPDDEAWQMWKTANT
ncbi:MAG: type I phosphomannose isomerase catalytic subunit [Ktedonobacteraceae bacterium]